MVKNITLIAMLLMMSGCQHCINQNRNTVTNLQAKQIPENSLRGTNYRYCKNCIPGHRKECRVIFVK